MRPGLAILTALILACSSRTTAQDAPATNSQADDTASRSPGVSNDPSNAATHYRRATEKYREINRRITENQWMPVYEFEGDPYRGASPLVRQTLRRLQPAVNLALSGSRRDSCHFEIDRAALDSQQRHQHLADLRMLARLMGYDFLVRVEDHDTRAVVEYLQAMYRMARHASAGGEVIDSLVGSALVAFADWRVGEALDHAMIGPVEATAVLREIDSLTGDDPMGYGAALANEQASLAETFAVRYSGEDGVEMFRAEYADWLARSGAQATLDDLTPESLQSMLSTISETAGRVATAFNDTDAARGLATMEQIKREAEAGPYGAFMASFVMIDGRSLRDTVQRTRKMLDDRRATLAGIAAGEIDPMSLANALVWYVRAVRQTRDIDPDKRRAIETYAAKHVAPTDAQLNAIFERHDVQTLLATLTTATEIDRCDWSKSVALWPYFFRWLHGEMIWCGRLLIADAARLFHAQRYQESAERLATAYRMCADVAADGTVGGSLVAHRIFVENDALAEAALDSRMFTPEQVALVTSGFDHLSRGDPFHYQPAMAYMRRNLEYPMRYWVQGLPADLDEMTRSQIETADALLANMDIDRVLSLAAAYAHWETQYYGARGCDREMTAITSGLAAVMNVDGLNEAAAFAPALTDWARSGRMTLVAEAPFPAIAPLGERAEQSMKDHRKAAMRFERLRPAEHNGD